MSTGTAPYTQIRSDCNYAHAMKFNVSNTDMLGHVLGMSFTASGNTLEPSLKVSDPLNPSSQVPVVGVVSFIHWEGGPTDPLTVRFLVPSKNRSKIKEALSSTTGGSDLSINFNIFEFDEDAKKYFLRLHSDNKDIQARIAEGTKMDVKDVADKLVLQPPIYMVDLTMSFKSNAGSQQLCCATSTNVKFTRQVGVEA